MSAVVMKKKDRLTNNGHVDKADMRPSSPVLHILVHIAVCGCLVDASPHCTVKKCNDRLSTLIKKFKVLFVIL